MLFTKAAVAALEVPTGKDDTIKWDDTMPGFGVMLRSNSTGGRGPTIHILPILR
jgi:hypothetical protein